MYDQLRNDKRFSAGGVFANGLTEQQKVAFAKEKPDFDKRISWRVMKRNASVFVRGKISHPDHKTIRLIGWHEVLMNTETRAEAMRYVAFLD